MVIGRTTRRSNGPSAWHRARSIDTIRKVKAAIRATAGRGLPVTLRSLSDATAEIFGANRRVTEKGILGNTIAGRLYYKYTTSKRRGKSRVRQDVPRSLKAKSAAALRIELVAVRAKLQDSEAARRGEIVRSRSKAVDDAEAEARRVRRAAPPYVSPSVVNVSPGRLQRGRRRRAPE